MTPERFSFLSNKHAVTCAAINVTNKNDTCLIELNCGHELQMTPHFSYKVGETHKCKTCGEKIVRFVYANEF